LGIENTLNPNSKIGVKVAVSRARDVLEKFGREPVEKTIWSSPAGKKKIADKLVKLLPAHSTYVEPFAGSAAVLFAKEPAKTEVINDADPEIVQAYRLIKRMNSEKLKKLRSMRWVGDANTYKRVRNSKPSGDVAKLYRFLYTTHFSYGRLRSSGFSPSATGVKATTVERVEKHAPRLRKVIIHGGDYERVVKQYDSKNTVFFLDPPYSGYNVNVGESKFDEEKFYNLLKSIKGKFLLTYGIKGKLPKLLKKSKFNVKRFKTVRHIRHMQGVEGPKMLTQLLVSNYSLVKKQIDELSADGLDFEDEPQEKATFEKAIRLVKNVNPEDERYVLGIVLEPEIVDAQGDVYSGEEIRQAAHKFMEEYGALGLMHQLQVNGQVKVLESFLAPADLKVTETSIRKGTWLLAVRILSDELWQQVKSGDLSGFSIGG